MSTKSIDHDMTATRWSRVKVVLANALEIKAAERASYLEHSCGDDVALRQEVESLLASADMPQQVMPTECDSVAERSAATFACAEKELLSVALGGQYEVLRLLGRGGMGAVYLARERALDRLVAIKVLRPDLAAVAEHRERFHREARIAARLSHPGVLQLYSLGEACGMCYFVMQFVRGMTLAELLRLDGPCTAARAHDILVQLAGALECAHRHGIIHRDIKPANVLIDDESGRVLLADFGISKSDAMGDDLTRTGAVLGTPDFMSPEQAMGAPDIDERSDLYALGALGYTMLTGRQPFAEAPARERAYRKMTERPVPLETASPSTPSALAQVIMRCLERERDTRWRNAGELLIALRRIKPEGALRAGATDTDRVSPLALIWCCAWTVLFLAMPGERYRAVVFLCTAVASLSLLFARRRQTQTVPFASALARTPRTGNTPADYHSAITELVPMLPISLAQSGSEAREAAHGALQAIVECDLASADIARIADDTDIDRLTNHLVTLDASPSHHTPTQQEVRVLMHRQLDVARALRAQRDFFIRRRAHLVDLLRSLWTHLALVRANHDQPAHAASLQERVSALCSEIRMELQKTGSRNSALVS